ncbi:MBL fold metallo-hydrolase [Schleiferilactobacillus harbinensis]|uniref:MBL fold metallo-hydrolase n=1 Tax=Schleiferilactobacillus harbinensis TaxID=304207 RepID=A0A5P8M6H2_9LACO|nr:MBL fold metallo-hydrolase [Schleiferilactobacillus harbinensis]QFR24108.1 MBL fold metallo-hydrolase [Schleiferilactobacillus harbinensis]
MVGLTVIGSGSSGNCYVLDNGTDQLMIEAGLPWKRVGPKLGFDYSRIKGLLVTHEHGDHAKYIKQYLQHTSAPVYMTLGTALALKMGSYRLVVIKARKSFHVGTWTVTPFETEHDAAEPVGFLLDAPAGDRVLYVTDTYFVRYRFSDVTMMMVEMNYSEQEVALNHADGLLPSALEKRIQRSHMAEATALEFIEANVSPKLQQVILIHTSQANSNPVDFVRKTEEITGVPVYIAGR